MPTLQERIDKRANIWDQMCAVKDRMDRVPAGEKPAAEDLATYNRLEADLDLLGSEIELEEKHQSRAAAFNKVDRRGVAGGEGDDDPDGEKEEKYARAFSNFLKDGMGDLGPEDKALMRGARVDLPKNAQGVGTSAGGGYVVPPLFRDKFLEVLKWYGPMLDLAEVITTDSGAQLPWPTNDDTANVGAILAENTQMTEQDVVLGTANIDAYMYTSKLIRVSYQLMQDSGLDFDSWLARKLGERIGRILNQHFTTGTGTAQPDGIVTSATVGVTGTGSFASTGGLSLANLINMTESMDPAYGNGNGLRWMMHQTARKQVRLLADTTGQPLWQPSLQVGAPDMLLGYPISLNNDMPTLAASSKSVLFGDIREAYVIRIVKGLTVMRLNERFADYLQVAFAAYERADGTMQNANAVRVFQTTATA